MEHGPKRRLVIELDEQGKRISIRLVGEGVETVRFQSGGAGHSPNLRWCSLLATCALYSAEMVPHVLIKELRGWHTKNGRSLSDASIERYARSFVAEKLQLHKVAMLTVVEKAGIYLSEELEFEATPVADAARLREWLRIPNLTEGNFSLEERQGKREPRASGSLEKSPARLTCLAQMIVGAPAIYQAAADLCRSAQKRIRLHMDANTPKPRLPLELVQTITARMVETRAEGRAVEFVPVLGVNLDKPPSSFKKEFEKRAEKYSAVQELEDAHLFDTTRWSCRDTWIIDTSSVLFAWATMPAAPDARIGLLLQNCDEFANELADWFDDIIKKGTPTYSEWAERLETKRTSDAFVDTSLASE